MSTRSDKKTRKSSHHEAHPSQVDARCVGDDRDRLCATVIRIRSACVWVCVCAACDERAANSPWHPWWHHQPGC